VEIGSTDRRELFREYMRRMDPKADPFAAIQAGLYVPSPLSTSSQVATRLELEPVSTHLIVGTTGSGKTTELLAVQRTLTRLPDIIPLFVDVPSVQQLSVISEGALVGLAWQMIWNDFVSRNPDAAVRFADAKYANSIVAGYWEDPRAYYEEPNDDVRVPGLLTPPVINDNLHSLEGYLRQLLLQQHATYVLLFDGLDRSRDVVRLTTTLLSDLFRLIDLGIGSVVVGPPELRGLAYREFNDRFATFHFHGAADPLDERSQLFLERVLEVRTLGSILQQRERLSLVEWSGGILRDLIALAKNAADNTYGDGRDSVDDADVSAAADRFGRSLLVGISDKTAARLSELGGMAKKRWFEFTMASPEDIELILRRLIIEIIDVPPRFFLHPTVRPLLRGLRRAI
jgi:hypothetical protein